MSPTEAREWLASNEVIVGGPAMIAMLAEWSDLELVAKVRHGVYLNLRATPTPTAMEAASRIRSGAVVSLQSVLGHAGVWNNDAHKTTVTGVLPLGLSRAVGTLEGEQGYTFIFAGMRDEMVNRPEDATWTKFAFQDGNRERASPEKALLDWIYLSKHSPGWRMPPRHDIDMDLLDRDRLDYLAQGMELTSELTAFEAGILRPPSPAKSSLSRRRRHP